MRFLAAVLLAGLGACGGEQTPVELTDAEVEWCLLHTDAVVAAYEPSATSDIEVTDNVVIFAIMTSQDEYTSIPDTGVRLTDEQLDLVRLVCHTAFAADGG